MEAMQEGQVTVEGETHRLPVPFHVPATATPASTKAPTRCPRPSWTGSCCASPSDTRRRTRSTTCWLVALLASRRRSPSRR
nr:AAA family ATPase [Nocardioides sp.]